MLNARCFCMHIGEGWTLFAYIYHVSLLWISFLTLANCFFSLLALKWESGKTGLFHSMVGWCGSCREQSCAEREESFLWGISEPSKAKRPDSIRRFFLSWVSVGKIIWHGNLSAVLKACPRCSKETQKLTKGNAFYNSDSSCKGKKKYWKCGECRIRSNTEWCGMSLTNVSLNQLD